MRNPPEYNLTELTPRNKGKSKHMTQVLREQSDMCSIDHIYPHVLKFYLHEYLGFGRESFSGSGFGEEFHRETTTSQTC